MAADPFFVDDGDIDAARVLVDSAPAAELFLYPGNDHLFTDSSLPSFDADATDLLVERALRLLSTALVADQPFEHPPVGLGERRLSDAARPPLVPADHRPFVRRR